MRRWIAFYHSLIGKKIIAAVTGAAMVLFLLGHAAGNLKVFVPDPEPGVADIDAYAEFLRSAGEPLLPHGAALWLIRVGLLVVLALHVVTVLELAARNRAARPVGYAGSGRMPTPWAARWMMVSGIAVFAFVVFHILHFTTGSIDPETFREGAVYANLHAAFTRAPFVTLYVLAMAAIAAHLFHGVWSLFQSLGLDNPDRNRMLRGIAAVIALGLFLGFVTVPLSFALGVLDERSPPGMAEIAPASGAAAIGPGSGEVDP